MLFSNTVTRKTLKNLYLPFSVLKLALRISPNASTPVRQENSSFVFCVYEGKGHTIVYGDDGEENVLNWENSDVFCIPCNMPFKHFNDSSNEQAYLFNFSDTPLLKNLNIHSSDLEVKN